MQQSTGLFKLINICIFYIVFLLQPVLKGEYLNKTKIAEGGKKLRFVYLTVCLSIHISIRAASVYTGDHIVIIIKVYSYVIINKYTCNYT